MFHEERLQWKKKLKNFVGISFIHFNEKTSLPHSGAISGVQPFVGVNWVLPMAGRMEIGAKIGYTFWRYGDSALKAIRKDRHSLDKLYFALNINWFIERGF